jgi:tight adherence protein C
MFTLIFTTITSPQFLIACFSALAVAATVYTATQPFLERDRLSDRIKAVALEREEIRARERARAANDAKRAKLRAEPKAYMRQIVESFNLQKALADEKTVDRLKMAGLRGQAPLVVFLFARVTIPLVLFGLSLFYMLAVADIGQPFPVKLLIALGFALAGFYGPNFYISNVVKKRQQSIRRAWPDALDLLLICVESGMSAEAAFRKVSEEIGAQSVALAEELTLTTAELSYLQERRQAYENLGARTGLETVKGVMTSLIQAERYGTPLGHSLRVLAQENRDQRMTAAEKKAAALPPKLTVPMILFFLPVLMAVILGPAAIKLIQMKYGSG